MDLIVPRDSKVVEDNRAKRRLLPVSPRMVFSRNLLFRNYRCEYLVWLATKSEGSFVSSFDGSFG